MQDNVGWILRDPHEFSKKEKEKQRISFACIAKSLKLRLTKANLRRQAMHAGRLLQTILKKSCEIHKKRCEVLLAASETLVKTGRLSVTGLGRGIINQTKPKYNINRMDRLVGNTHLYEESLEIYRANAHFILGHRKKAIVVVDWSSATIAERYQLLRAAVPMGGRTLTLYEEVHELKNYNNPHVHKVFLKNLSKVLPRDCEIIIVTDAGFGIPWFKEVLKRGWDYVGRVINKSYYREEGKQWASLTTLLSYEKAQIKRLGKVELSKAHEFKCYLQVYKSGQKGRVRKNVYGERSRRSVSRRSAKQAKQAWVLVSSLGSSHRISKAVVKIYEKRMQIEESFRDIKNPQFGFGLRYSRSLGIKRISNLFLIGLLGTLIAWITGLSAKEKKLHYVFQSNSVKNKNVLSVFFIGCQVIRHLISFRKAELMQAVEQMKKMTDYASILEANS